LIKLFQQSHRRVNAEEYDRYRPIPLDRLRQLAAYTSNLVLLRVAIATESKPVSINQLTDGVSGNEFSQREWRIFVNLWRAGLELDGWLAMLSILSRNGEILELTSTATIRVTSTDADYIQSKLEGDNVAESRLP
jgi:hypothetical protein